MVPGPIIFHQKPEPVYVRVCGWPCTLQMPNEGGWISSPLEIEMLDVEGENEEEEEDDAYVESKNREQEVRTQT